jgi:hypothetical protein
MHRSRSLSIALRGIRGGDHEATTAAGCTTGGYGYSRSLMASAGLEIWYPRVVPMGPTTRLS